MAEVLLPTSLIQLFPGCPRRLRVEGATVGGVIDALDERWPGMRNRLCVSGPALRQHIRIFVNAEPATLETPVAATSEVQIVPALSGG